MTIRKIARSLQQETIYVSGNADVTLTFCRRDADHTADLAADVRSPGSPQSDLFLQNGLCIHSAIKSIN
jgi:hypothetical protein